MSNAAFWADRKHGLKHAGRHAERPIGDVQREFVEEVSARLSPGLRVLELGCSGGHWCERLRILAEGRSYTGIDINPHVVEQARRDRPGATFMCACLAKIQAVPDCDYAIARHTLMFLDRTSVERLLALLPRGAMLTIEEPVVPEIATSAESIVIPNNKPGAKGAVTMYAHPYPAILRSLRFSILSERLFAGPKSRYLVTSIR